MQPTIGDGRQQSRVGPGRREPNNLCVAADVSRTSLTETAENAGMREQPRRMASASRRMTSL
jgi:hypothetical protein